MRLSIVCDLSHWQRHELEVLQRQLAGYLSGVRWVKPQEMHLTIFFLGETAEDLSSRISDTVQSASKDESAFIMKLSGCGVFPDASEVIALETGLGRTFVGSIILAIATSLPEVIITSTAARLGKLDMAVGNIFGANMYNMFILGIIYFAYFPGSLFKDSSFEHLLTILMCIALTSTITVGLANRYRKVLGPIGYDSIIIVMGYLIAIAVLFYMRVG